MRVWVLIVIIPVCCTLLEQIVVINIHYYRDWRREELLCKDIGLGHTSNTVEQGYVTYAM